MDSGDGSVTARSSLLGDEVLSTDPLRTLEPEDVLKGNGNRSRPGGGRQRAPSVDGSGGNASYQYAENHVTGDQERGNQQDLDGYPTVMEGSTQDIQVDPDQHRQEGNADLPRGQKDIMGDTPPSGGTTTSGAACSLTSDLSRLASRQSVLADELLEVSAAGPPDQCKVSKAAEAMVALGQSVGLQARAVGLMEEVVVRTGHSRVSG